MKRTTKEDTREKLHRQMLTSGNSHQSKMWRENKIQRIGLCTCTHYTPTMHKTLLTVIKEHTDNTVFWCVGHPCVLTQGQTPPLLLYSHSKNRGLHVVVHTCEAEGLWVENRLALAILSLKTRVEKRVARRTMIRRYQLGPIDFDKKSHSFEEKS